ncbi:DUF4389 domain-containing protein [Actinokineospora soli]|uniref:DUF4389 domain-containing protein n=1 Tax=Actinokineospora soli TaxID=1048753 RepID=A0ABW2TQA0_9PSEU
MAQPYPLRVTGVLDAPLSRWLWLVKWLLLVPHYLVLTVLWAGFALATAAAFFAILVTGRYPRPLFDFTSGVLRWSWRVHYYGYGALGTDRYPPFTLADVPDYPARLDIAYPARLSRGLVLVKWLLAVPHFVVVAVLAGGGAWFAVRDGEPAGWGAGGLVPLLVVAAGVVLLFRARYPAGLHPFVVGLDRWALRVTAYAALMTDEYPPFRLDQGGAEPGVPATAPPPPPSGGGGARVAAAVVGVLLTLSAALPLLTGAVLLWTDTTQREDGFLTAPAVRVSTPGYAITSGTIALPEPVGWADAAGVVGTVRVTVDRAAGPVFVGVGPAAEVDRYLDGVAHAALETVVVTDGRTEARLVEHPGAAPALPPATALRWRAVDQGAGPRVLTWTADPGDWRFVVMAADARPGVDVEVTAGATVPPLPWIAVGLLVLGAALGAGGVTLLLVGLRTPPRAPVPTIPRHSGEGAARHGD